MRKILFLLLVVALLVGTASATYTITNIPLYDKKETDIKNVKVATYDAMADNQRIAQAMVLCPTGSYVNFTIFYGTQTLTGSVESRIISTIPWYRTVSTIVFNGTTKHYDFLDQQPFYDLAISGYAKDDATNQAGFLVHSMDYGNIFGNDLAVFSPVADIGSNTMWKISATSQNNFDIYIVTAAPETVSRGATVGIIEAATSAFNEWVTFAVLIATFVYETVATLFYWLKFFFYDNLLMTIGLYLALTMAFAARAARGNIAKFLRQWFSDQVKLFNFIIGLWRVLVEIIGTFRGIFRI